MKDKLTEFANALDQDPALQNKYTQNPRQTLEAFGVDEADITLLLSEDMKAIKDRLEMSGMKAILLISKPN